MSASSQEKAPPTSCLTSCDEATNSKAAGWSLIKRQRSDPTSAPIRISTAHVLITPRLQKCCRGNRMEMGIIMYSWCWRPGGCGACSLGTALYPEPDVSGQNHSTRDSSRILRSHDRMEGGREEEETGGGGAGRESLR